MKALFVSALLLCASIAAVAQSPSPSPSPKSPHLYIELIEKAKRGDATVNFVELRNAYGDWQCEENTDAPNRDAMVNAFNAQD